MSTPNRHSTAIARVIWKDGPGQRVTANRVMVSKRSHLHLSLGGASPDHIRYLRVFGTARARIASSSNNDFGLSPLRASLHEQAMYPLAQAQTIRAKEPQVL